MSFANAIPVNRVTSSSATYRPAYGANERPRSWSNKGSAQSVNISEETLQRIAREKLAKAIKYKIGYTREGTFRMREPVGLKFSAKA